MNAPIDVLPARNAKLLTSYRPYWAGHRAPFLPMSCAEMEQLGWDSAATSSWSTGDAYVDHPSWHGVIGRVLEGRALVGIIAQP